MLVLNCLLGKGIFMLKLIQIQKNDGFATVTIDNPPMNVLSKQVTQELYQTFSQLKDDHEVISIILTGSGEKAFMAGADIKEFPKRVMHDIDDKKVTGHQLFNFIENLPKPTIALLNGYTLGGGLELALSCDIRIAEAHAKIGLPEINLGIFPGGGGTQRLPRLIGPAKAKEIMFTGEPLEAEDALKLGIVNRVVPKGEGKVAAEEMAAKFSSKSLQSLSRIKRAVNDGLQLPLEEGLQLEENLFNEVFHTEDAKEGVNAFIEKRKAVFTHK